MHVALVLRKKNNAGALLCELLNAGDCSHKISDEDKNHNTIKHLPERSHKITFALVKFITVAILFQNYPVISHGNTRKKPTNKYPN